MPGAYSTEQITQLDKVSGKIHSIATNSYKLNEYPGLRDGLSLRVPNSGVPKTPQDPRRALGCLLLPPSPRVYGDIVVLVSVNTNASTLSPGCSKILRVFLLGMEKMSSAARVL